METKINYFTTEAQIAEVIGEGTVAHGLVVIESRKYVLEGSVLKYVGDEQKNIECRFKVIDGVVYISNKNRRKFYIPSGKFVSAIITK